MISKFIRKRKFTRIAILPHNKKGKERGILDTDHFIDPWQTQHKSHTQKGEDYLATEIKDIEFVSNKKIKDKFCSVNADHTSGYWPKTNFAKNMNLQCV